MPESLLKHTPLEPEVNNRLRHYHLYNRLEVLLKTVSVTSFKKFLPKLIKKANQRQTKNIK